MNSSIKSIVVLLAICLVVAAALAAVNFVTEPIIKESEEKAANEALLVVMPDGKGFEEIKDLSPYTLPVSVTNVFSEAGGGYVFRLSVTGYSSGMILMCGINSNGEITGATCVSSSETLGVEKVYGDYFKGADAESVDGVDSVAGSTARLTMNAYKSAMKDSLSAFAIMRGEDVDIRTDEEKLADNLKAALPDGDDFSKWFRTETLDPSVTGVYISGNDAGLVVKLGDVYIGINQNGGIVSGDASDELSQAAMNAFMTVYAAEINEIDLTKYEGISNKVVSAYKTVSGNYFFHLKAAGFGITGVNVEYADPSGEYIEIDVSISSNGTILDCLTTYQSESKGIGDICADPSYYGKFIGESANTVSGIDVGSGATYTADGYKKAIGDAFAAVEILKGAK